jgi:hypothetical protein
MRLLLAIKAFFKAWKDPASAQTFLDEKPATKEFPSHDHSHLRLLALLQQSGRLIDFLKEDIHDFTDAQIGAAVRQIHQDCGKSLEELITLRPLIPEKEGTSITIQKGYDPAAIKILGKVRGEPPYTGTVVHPGWKAHKRSLPQKMGEQSSEIICPAEIEVK